MTYRQLVRFEKKLTKDLKSGCWLWNGSLFERGYGRFWFNGKIRQAHVVAYEHWVGLVAIGLELDHLCRIKKCVNPGHLESVTHRINVLRGDGVAARQAKQTSCKNGHPLSAENLYNRKNKRRQCKICGRRYAANRYLRLRGDHSEKAKAGKAVDPFSGH